MSGAGPAHHPPPVDHRHGFRTTAAALLVLLMLLPLPSGAHPPAPAVTGPGSVHVAWAYAGTLEEAATSLVGNVSLGYTDSSNYAVVLNQTSPNASTIDLSISRLISTRSYFLGCYPNCSAPIAAMTGSGVGIEFDTAQLVLTRNASVLVGGHAVPALGLRSENLTLSGNLTVRFSWENFSGGGRPRAEWFNGTTLANTTGGFVARVPLGLVPEALVSGEAWNGTGVFAAAASTLFSGHTRYQGDLVPANGSEFNGSSVPISPMTVVVNASDTGAPSNPAAAGDSALDFAPASDDTSLLEGAVLVPTSAYIAAAFSSDCDAAQRACIGVGATPELDYNATEPGHLGWDAAVSAVSAFSLVLGPSAILDTPDGLPFWPSAAKVPATVPALPTGLTTITGSPIPVGIALSIQHTFDPPPNPNGSLPPSDSTAAPVLRPPTTVGGRTPGGIPRPASPLPTGAVGGAGIPVLALIGAVVIVAAVGVSASALAARRRRPPRRRETETRELPPADPPPDGSEPSEDPMGYVW